MRRQAQTFIADQIRKLIQTPSRVFILPFLTIDFIATQLIKAFKRPARIGVLLSPLVTSIRLAILSFLLCDGPIGRLIFPIAKRAIPASTFSRVAQHYFQIAHQKLDANEPAEAWGYFRTCLKYSTNPTHFSIAAICLMVGLGRFKEAIALFARSNDLLRDRAKVLGYERSQFRFLDQFWAGGFGHLAQIDYFAKLEILEQRKRTDSVLYIPPGFSVPNRFLLDLWRPYLQIVEDETKLPARLEDLNSLSFNFLAPRLADGSTVHLWEIGAKTYRRWEQEGRGPLLALSSEITNRGRRVLEAWGIPQDTWFVALHVREAGSRKYHADLHGVLNADVSTYKAAIEEITRRGGWVVRMGDPTMTKLPQMANVFDYCHSSDRSEWMDIFLCASARFYVGTSSGPAYVPTDFGVPCVHTNWWPPGQRPWDSRDIFIPKLYRKIADKSILTLSQSLREPFGYCNSIAYLSKTQGIEVIDSTAEEIQEAVIEILNRLDNSADYDSSDLRLRQEAERIYQSNNVHGAALLAQYFLRKHSSFLE